MPVGGIGTGFFTLGGRGDLREWQLMSRPNRGWKPRYAHLLVRWSSSESTGIRVLERDFTEQLASDHGHPDTLAGIGRFEAASFEAAYPFGAVELRDSSVPFTVRLEAMNPLVPNDADNSGLPLGLITITVRNHSDHPLDLTTALLLSNFVGCDGIDNHPEGNTADFAAIEGWQGVQLSNPTLPDSPQTGTIAVLCDAPTVVSARSWSFEALPWQREQLGVIDSMLELGEIPDADPKEPCKPGEKHSKPSSVCGRVKCGAGETVQIRYLVVWNFPWRNLKECGWLWRGGDGSPLARNYYASGSLDAVEIARKCAPQIDDLEQRTAAWVRSVADRSAPDSVKEAAMFTLTGLRTHTCFRLEGGAFYGFEGCNSQSGCCAGSCTHVWNYEEATSRLFPELDKSMLEGLVLLGVAPNGGQRFRLALPLDQQAWDHAAADGQMGLIVRCYERWKRDRNDEWLNRMWPGIKRMMAFAWVPNGWDADRDGVMEGSQHNTYDVEFFGPNPMMGCWYLAGLKACTEMAEVVGDQEFAAECSRLAASGSAWLDSNLFNGDYYEQHVRPIKGEVAEMTSSGYDHSSDEPPYQVGPGCLIDQLVGQYKANRAGLGDLMSRSNVKKALKSIVKHNYQTSFKDVANNMRTYAIGNEAGTLICTYPRGGRPSVPFPYWAEVWTGLEYQLAALLVDYGMKRDALKVVQAVRSRHAGTNRNPFNEPECGSYYARAMSAWGVLEAWSESEPAGEAAE